MLAADSMDVLNLVVAIHDELGVDIPEADYGKIDTLDDCLDYLATAIATRDERAAIAARGASSVAPAARRTDRYFTVSFFAADVAFFGSVSSRTPSVYFAVASTWSTSLPSEKLRSIEP